MADEFLRLLRLLPESTQGEDDNKASTTTTTTTTMKKEKEMIQQSSPPPSSSSSSSSPSSGFELPPPLYECVSSGAIFREGTVRALAEERRREKKKKKKTTIESCEARLVRYYRENYEHGNPHNPNGAYPT